MPASYCMRAMRKCNSRILADLAETSPQSVPTCGTPATSSREASEQKAYRACHGSESLIFLGQHSGNRSAGRAGTLPTQPTHGAQETQGVQRVPNASKCGTARLRTAGVTGSIPVSARSPQLRTTPPRPAVAASRTRTASSRPQAWRRGSGRARIRRSCSGRPTAAGR